MMSINCIIVDDEPRAHYVLKHYIDKLPELQLAASCMNVMEAHNYLKQNKADIIFLDINMPELDGFSLLELSATNAAVIITTAYTDYAFKSYEYDAVDYLHKPIRFERFVVAVEKARKRILSVAAPQNNKTLIIRTDGYSKELIASQILFTESLGNYVKIFCTDTEYMVLMTTKELKAQLDPDIFTRVHKSYLINLGKITRYDKEHTYIGMHKIPIGKTYKIHLEEQIKRYNERAR